MNHSASLLLACTVTALLAGCQQDAQTQDTATKAPTSAEGTKAEAAAAAPMLVADTTIDQAWPPTGCPDAAAVRAFIANPGNQQFSSYLGLYSGDDNPVSNGNIVWLGYAHGASIQPPNVATIVPKTASGQGWMLRWNISDRVAIGGNSAKQAFSSHYAWDYDASRDGDYAVAALAINKCTQHGNNPPSCEQPLFGKDAWQADERGHDFDICPPVILSEDPTSLYAFDRNTTQATYDYSLAFILRSGDTKTGLRIIVDPKVENGGVQTR